MRQRNILIALLVLLVISIAGVTGCNHTEAPLRLGHNPWPGYLGLYYARDKGLFSDRDVRLIALDSTEDVLTAFRNRAIDAAALTLDEALLLADSDQEPRIVMIFDSSKGADVVLARPDITTPAELRQHRLGVETSTLGAYLLARLLDRTKLQPGDMEIVHLPLHRQVAAYHQGLVDAVITFDPPRSQLLAAGARPIFSSADIPGEIVDVLVVRDDTLQHHQQHIRLLLDSYFKALAELQEEPQHAAQLLAPYIGLEPKALLEAWQLMELADLADNRVMLAPESPLLDTLGRMEKIMLEHKLLEQHTSTRSMLHSELLYALDQ